MNLKTFLTTLTIFLIIQGLVYPQNSGIQNKDKKINEDSLFIVQQYEKYEYQISMRDGIKLFTVVYSPKNKSQKYPIMLFRTPYSIGPYGDGKLKTSLGPSMLFARELFIFAYQDVRGRFMSEGVYENMRPQIDDKKKKTDIDESSDTYDTIDWLIKQIANNNGNVGMWGISYPGFYTAVGSLSGHSALKAVSPQAPISDWWIGDDFHHNGAYFLDASFNFLSVFSQAKPKITTEWGHKFEIPVKDGYQFFLNDVGPLKNVNDKYFKDTIPYWNVMCQHPDYDDFWKARNLLPHLKNVKPAVMTVGGWFDAEDLYGPLKIYENIEKNNSGTFNILVMGPWSHGGWARTSGAKLGNVFFTDNPPPSKYYQENIEFPFFMYYLKNSSKMELPEAYCFETGKNIWRKFDTWPPKNLEKKNLYFTDNHALSFFHPDNTSEVYDEYVSDPMKPVPYTETITNETPKPYMCDDQRFTSKRPDVLVYQTKILEEDITLAGPITANLYVSTSGEDADWIVKLIDVYADTGVQSGYQQLVRGEVFRGRYRKSYDKPIPFISNEITEIKFYVPDILHTFKKGNKIMIQIQSTWFPLIDRNPQKFVKNIFEAGEGDFIKANHRIYRSKTNSSYFAVGELK